MSIFNRKQTVEIDYDKLANAIVKAQDKANTETIKDAIIAAKKELKTKEIEEQKQKTEQWQKTIGYSQQNSETKNNFNILRKLMTIKKKEIVADFANQTLLKLAISLLYFLLEYLLYVLCFAFFVLLITNLSFMLGMVVVAFEILGIVIARIVRVARFEIDNINDKNYLISIISTSASVFALVVTIVTIFANK